MVEAQPHHSDHGWYHSDPQLDGRHKMSWVPAVFVILVVIVRSLLAISRQLLRPMTRLSFSQIIIVVVAVVQK